MKQENNNPKTIDFQPPNVGDTKKTNRELLESTRLFRFPSLPKRTNFIPNFQPPAKVEDTPEVCVGCNVRLTTDNQKIRARVCVKCASIYATITVEIERSADEKCHPAKLAKFGGDR